MIQDIGFTGTRHGMTWAQKQRVRAILEELKATAGHHGDCVGADEEFGDICQMLGMKIVTHPPLNEKHRAFAPSDEEWEPLPYRKRNGDIVHVSDALIAASKTETEAIRSGTWMTVRISRRRTTKPILIVYPDGTLKTERPDGGRAPLPQNLRTSDEGEVT